MSNREWTHVADTLHAAFVNDKWPLWLGEDTRFLSLALCGEVGELANEIKKEWRGDGMRTDAIRKELADVQIYLYLLARCFEVDLDDAATEKLLEVSLRFSKKPELAE